MAGDAHPRLTPSEGRRFAFTVAAGFSALGAVALLRAHPSLARTLFTVAALVAAGGAVVPTRLGALRAAWMGLGVALSRITGPVFYAIVYWLLLTPMGVLRRTFGRSPLARDPEASSYWVSRERPDDETARRRLERQF